MNLEKIVSISGKPGLYEVISQSNKSLIVQSLVDKKRLPVHTMHNVSVLNDIAIYTLDGEEPLRNVFKAIAAKNDNKEVLSHKESDARLIGFFSDVLPNYDTERVYASNIKKVVQWYNLLAASKFDFSSIKEPETKA